MAGVVVLPDCCRQRQVEIRVRTDDERRLSAKLEAARRETVAAADPISRAVSGEPVNEMRRTPRIGHERRAGPLADPLHDVQHTGRKTRFDGRGPPASRPSAASTPPASGTTVLPAASAGPIFQVASISGAFQA